MDQKKIEFLLDNDKIRSKKLMKIEEVMAACDHKKQKKGRGKTTLRHVTGKEYKCEICKAQVDFGKSTTEQVQKATETCINAIQCLKAVCTSDELDEKALEDLGNAILILERLPKVFKSRIADELAGGGNIFKRDDDDDDNMNPIYANMMPNNIYNNPFMYQQMMMQGGKHGGKHHHNNKGGKNHHKKGNDKKNNLFW